MISREELKEVLKQADFNDEQINRILNKRINTLLKNGNKDRISGVLKVLNKYKIRSKALEKCLSVLARGKADKIEKILEVLYKPKYKIRAEAVENFLIND